MCRYTSLFGVLTISVLLQHLGDTVSTLDDLINGKHKYSSKLMSAKRPMIVVGSEALQREDGSAIQRLTQELSAKLKAKSDDPTWKIFNVLHKVSVSHNHTWDIILDAQYIIVF